MSHFVDSIVLEIPPDTLNQGEGAILSAIALKLYAQGIFTFGQARKLTNLSMWEFQQLLGQHRIERHYDETDLAEDINSIAADF